MKLTSEIFTLRNDETPWHVKRQELLKKDREWRRSLKERWRKLALGAEGMYHHIRYFESHGIQCYVPDDTYDPDKDFHYFIDGVQYLAESKTQARYLNVGDRKYGLFTLRDVNSQREKCRTVKNLGILDIPRLFFNSAPTNIDLYVSDDPATREVIEVPLKKGTTEAFTMESFEKVVSFDDKELAEMLRDLSISTDPRFKGNYKPDVWIP